MDYIELACEVQPRQPASEILIAELADLGFESFVETDNGFLAYIPAPEFNENRVKETIANSQLTSELKKLHWNFIKDQNWNEQWEKSYDPIIIDNCIVRAPFHKPEKKFQFDIVIEPKMSFGTGHHATTSLMIEAMLDLNFEDTNVLDMGCGTSVLAILASMKGAKSVLAVDIEEWAYQNSLENAKQNKCDNITVLMGDSSVLEAKKFNVILANINRNVLLKDIPVYVNSLLKSGKLLLSGFFETDIPLLKQKAEAEGLVFNKQKLKNEWAMLEFDYI